MSITSAMGMAKVNAIMVLELNLCVLTAMHIYRLSDGVPTWRLKSISDHPSFHGSMAGKSARRVLKNHFRQSDSNRYLTRYSERKYVYILSVIQKKMDYSTEDDFLIRHYKLNIDKHIHNRERIITEIEGTEEQFDSIFDLLAFYERNPVDHDIVRIGECIVDDYRRRFFDFDVSLQGK